MKRVSRADEKHMESPSGMRIRSYNEKQASYSFSAGNRSAQAFQITLQEE